MTKNFGAFSKDTFERTSTISNILWSVGALFAVPLAFIASGVTVLVIMCLLRLIDLTA
jgi:hypothetical protein